MVIHIILSTALICRYQVRLYANNYFGKLPKALHVVSTKDAFCKILQPCYNLASDPC